jgi:GNAT superfamily N-acetyltransferase
VSSASVPSAELLFREGRVGDLEASFWLSQRVGHEVATRHGWLGPEAMPDDEELRRRWESQRPLLEFVAAQPESRHWVCEDGDEVVGCVQAVRFGHMEELADLAVAPSHQRRGVGSGLLERVWPDPPTPELGRVAIAAGAQADLSLYTLFGAMPITGHWHLRQRVEEYVERRSQETLDVPEPGVHVLEADRAVAEWKRLEPVAIGHERPTLHEFFGRTRTCLACIGDDGQPCGVCWVSRDGEIGPAVGATPEDLVPLVLAALDRLAKTQEPESFGVFCTTDSWWLLRRLRRLGFRVAWPSWVMCSIPLPGLDRYLPTRPPRLL